MATIGTDAGSRAFEAGAGRHLEVSKALLDRTLTPQISVLISFDLDADLVSKISEVIHIARLSR